MRPERARPDRQQTGLRRKTPERTVHAGGVHPKLTTFPAALHHEVPRKPLSPDAWLRDMFASKAAQRGEVIRRKVKDIERFVGMERFLAEIDRRGYQVAENAGQVVIFCNRDPVRWLTRHRRFLSKKAARNP